MQRSHSMHSSSSDGDLDALSSGSSQSLTSPNRMTFMPRSLSSNGVAIDILDVPLRPLPINDKKSKPDTSFRCRNENYVHSIPFILLFCYFFLWITSSGLPNEIRSTDLKQ